MCLIHKYATIFLIIMKFYFDKQINTIIFNYFITNYCMISQEPANFNEINYVLLNLLSFIYL